MRRKCGFTVIDQLITIVLLALVLAISLRGVGVMRDTLAVQAAARAVKDAFALAREHAGAAGLRTAVRLSEAHGRVTVHAGADSLAQLALTRTHGVTFTTTRDSMSYLPSGLGFGASNLSLVLSRGTIVDTITVSRLGRVR
jgi:type II secretory pathway pseudopilin PulG